MWQIGNTTVRTALRLREGLIALEKSGKQDQVIYPIFLDEI